MSDEGLTRVLVVDDETAVRRLLRHLLEGARFVILEARTGNEALTLVRQKHPDLVLLDLGLPDLNGLDVLRVLREWSRVPVVVLSVQDAEDDIVGALDAGADDYLTKPFGTAELQARIRSALRRSAQSGEAGQNVFNSGNLLVNLANRVVTVDGKVVSLTPTEYDLLKVFVQHAGRVLTHVHLLRSVWGNGYVEDVGVLRVNISNLRKKIYSDSGSQVLVTEPGVGYRLQG